MKTLTTEELSDITNDAFDAFWEVVVRRFPESKSGDLSPLTSVRLTLAAEHAVKEWIALNCP